MMKVKPYVVNLPLTEEEVTKWIEVTKAAYAARKWSDPKCNPE